MRSRIDRSIGYRSRSAPGTHRTSLLSSLGAGVPPVARAVRRMENSGGVVVEVDSAGHVS